MNQELINDIKHLVNKLSDFNNTDDIAPTTNMCNKDPIKSYRMQTEYGPKKFIKP